MQDAEPAGDLHRRNAALPGWHAVASPGTPPAPHSGGITTMQGTASARTIRESMEEYGRGIIGGLLFSLPLLYTMEVWWRGFTASPVHLLVYLGLTFVLLLAYNRYCGMRRDAHFLEVVIDSVEELGLGLVVSAAVLAMLGRIHGEMPMQEIAGKIVIEGMTVAIGVSVGTAQLGGGERKERQDQGVRDGSSQPPNFWDQTVLGFCGAILIVSNVAPTEEVVMIGVEVPPRNLLILMAVSLGLCAVTLHFSEFIGAKGKVRTGGWRIMVSETVVSYAVALMASALMLWIFGRFADTSWKIILAQTVVLGFPGAIGASAGRLLIQS